ncbi:hypothetical protein L5515_002315 [Caenorhabditis briggsae]|uniref:Uncharacterized protein n=1 Tax=Caenorhabditis briggsae TaxID=6238 RepID=A0AAE9E8E5_CAEBR|nr:hypothetical protein L5515_002315 [Caenorhabditis briggsae]
MAGVFSKVLVYFGLEERSFTQNTPNTTSKDAKFYTRKCVKTGNSILITQDANGRIRIFEFLENSENGFQNHEQCPTCKEYIYVHEETKKSEDVPKRYSEADAKASEDVQIGDVKDSGKEDVQKSDDVQDSEKRTEDKSQGVEDAEEDVEASEGDMYSPGENVETLGDVEDLEEGVKNSGEGVEDLEHEWGSEDYTQWEESDSEDFNDSDPWTASLQESMRKLKNPKTDSEDVNAAKNTSEVVRKFRNLMNEIHEENQRRNEELLKIFK